MQLWAAAGARSPIRGQQEAGCGDDEGESDLPSMVQWALGFSAKTPEAQQRVNPLTVKCPLTIILN